MNVTFARVWFKNLMHPVIQGNVQKHKFLGISPYLANLKVRKCALQLHVNKLQECFSDMLEIQQLCSTASNTGIGSVQQVVAEFEFGTRRKKNISRKRKHEQKFESGLLRNETQEIDRGSLRKDRKQTYKMKVAATTQKKDQQK